MLILLDFISFSKYLLVQEESNNTQSQKRNKIPIWISA